MGEILDDRTDGELLSAFRSGESGAFDDLFRRHYAAGREFAARIAGRDHADDRAAEAFARVYRVLRDGAGPDRNFRAYLFSAIRNTHVDTLRRPGSDDIPVDGLGHDERAADNVEDEATAKLDAVPIRRAFARLKPSWRTVLWHTAVLGESHDVVAKRLGSNPNAVAVLSFRAREGLRQAYLAEHVRAAQNPQCQATAPHLPRYIRGQLTGARKRTVADHVTGCLQCQGAIDDLAVLNSNLAAILTPAVVLSAPAGAALVTEGAGGAAASALNVAAKVVGGIAVGVGAVAAAAAMLVTSGRDSADRPLPTTQAAPSAHHSPAVVRTLITEAPQVPTPIAEPTAEATVEPTTVEPTAEPPVTPVTSPSPARPPTTAPPPDPTPTEKPATAQVSPSRVTVSGSDQIRVALVTVDVTPAQATTLVIGVTNAAGLTVSSDRTSCSPAATGGSGVTVRCRIESGGPPTFTASIQVQFADPGKDVAGRVMLAGTHARSSFVART